MQNQFSRRSFLTQASVSVLAMHVSTLGRTPLVHAHNKFEDPSLLNQLLSLVNKERGAAGLNELKLDDLACKVAQRHATEMAENGFLSHWNREGLKPYQRYSLAGGTEAIAENDGAVDQNVEIPPEEFTPTIIGLHQAMHDEQPPNDGHRKTILSPQHTHVGFGMACSGKHVRLSEIYLARYLAIDRYPAVLKEPGLFIFSGQILDPTYVVKLIDIYYEPLPATSDLPSLLAPRPYAMPNEKESLWPKLPRGKIYEDGSRGSIDVMKKGEFRVLIEILKQPGIYTIVVWLNKPPDGAPFAVTQACVRTG